MFDTKKVGKIIEMDEQVLVLLYQVAQEEDKSVDKVIEKALGSYIMRKQKQWQEEKRREEVSGGGDK